MLKLPGKIDGIIVKLRLPYSGTIESINISPGDRVKQGQVLLKLNTKQLALRHQKELRDYEKQRADFEKFKQTTDSSNPLHKYLADRAGAELDQSVKSVELSQFSLDQAILKSPINGLVLETDNLLPGINISPASYPIKILKTDTLHFLAEVKQEQISQIKKDKLAEITLTAFPSQKFRGRVHNLSPMADKKDNFSAKIVLEKYDNLYLGLTGEAVIHE
jgi:multidrug resistance efflux pump